MLTNTQTARQLRKYLNSQNLYTSVRMTAAALVPSVILYHYNLLLSAIALPLGAIFTGFVDSPGPLHYRRNSLAASILINFLIILMAGTIHKYPPFVITAIIFLGMFFSMLAVYGTRAASIGLNGLLVFIFNIDGHLLNSTTALNEALLFAAGGIWYTVLTLVSYSLRPYKIIQQMLGECIIETADYLKIKSDFYTQSGNHESLSDSLLQKQVTIKQLQDELREILFKTRSLVQDSTVRSRVLMSVFLDIIDLMERIMTSQYDYEVLHQKFKDSDILHRFGKQIFVLAGELNEVGLALQSGVPSSGKIDLDALQEENMNTFLELRKNMLNENTVADFIALRQILYSLQDVTERIKRLRLSTFYDVTISNEYKNKVDLQKFITSSNFEPRLLINNLSLQSTIFRHSVRLTIGLLIGYAISLFFPLGHSYWILLTIAVIIKPAYSISRQRNIQRVAGTITGALLGFGILYFIHDNAVLFVIMTVTMVIAYSFLRLNYFIGCVGITLYVLMSFSFLSAAGFHHALNERVIDTLIGSGIAWLISIFVLPAWEHKQIDEYIAAAIDANQKYFDTVALSFLGKPADETIFKLHRRDAFVALANLSDTFQRMMSEPKNRQVKLQQYHQFVATSHTLTAYIASLSYYAQRNAASYASEEFLPVVTQINNQFKGASDVLLHHQPIHAVNIQSTLPINKRVEELLQQRRREISSGQSETLTPARKSLSDLKTIYDQFALISTATVDEIRILEKMAEV